MHHHLGSTLIIAALALLIIALAIIINAQTHSEISSSRPARCDIVAGRLVVTLDHHHLIAIAIAIAIAIPIGRRGRVAAVAEEAFDAPREDLPAFVHVGPVPVVHK